MADHKITIGIATIFLFLMISFVSAVSTVPTSVILNKDITSIQIEFQGLTNSTSLSLSSSIAPYTQLNFYDVTPSERWVTISLKNNVPAGSYVGSIDFSGGSVPVAIIIEAPPENTTTGCVVDVFPTILTNIKVQQGATKTRTVQLSVPSCFPSYVTIQGVTLQTDEKPIELGEISIGKVNPGSSISVPLEINGVDAVVGQYSDILQFLVYDINGNKVNVPSVSISVSVTHGTQPTTSDTFSTPPSCALSSTTLSLNQTYSFTCSGVVSNIQVSIPSNEYYVGKNVDITSSLYRYDFTPIKYGETKFKAEFKYQGASIFSPFESNLAITTSGTGVAGTDLAFYFTPKLDSAKVGEPIYIQLVDNRTGSLVENPTLLIDAKPLNNTAGSFQFFFEASKDYELRGKAPGYPDIIKTINIVPKDLEIIVNPPIGDASTLFNITVNTPNATLTIRGQNYIGTYYGSLPAGVNEIVATKEGYTKKSINITIDDTARVVFGGTDFKKGKEQTLSLNKNVSWTLFYKPKIDSPDADREILNVGNSNQIVFTPKKHGVYQIGVDGNIISTYETVKFSFSQKWWFLPVWGWLLVIVVLIVLIIFIAILKGPSSSSYQGQGLSYQVGDGQ